MLTETRWVGKRRRRSPNGVYVECRTGLLGLHRCRGCRRCGGDGLRKVGTKRRGRGQGPSKRGPKGAVRRGMWRLGWAGAFITLGHARFGSIGAIVVSAFVVVWLVLVVLHWITGAKKPKAKR